MVVWRRDRLGRSLRNPTELVGQLDEANVGFLSIQEAVGCCTSGGKLVVHVFGALAELKCNLFHGRTLAGLAAYSSVGHPSAPENLGDPVH